MKKIAFISIVVSITLFSQAQQVVKLQDGTQVDIITTESISSKTARERDQIIFHMAEDVIVDGKIVIKGGSVVKGEITEAEKAKMFGKPGKLDFSLDYAKAVDGQNVRLRATKSMEGKDKSAGVIAAAVLFAPVAIFIKGKDVTIEKGKRFTVYVDRDYTIIPVSTEPIAQKNMNDTLSTKKPVATPANNTNSSSVADELKKLKELHDSGVLTKDEYEKAKKKLLNQ